MNHAGLQRLIREHALLTEGGAAGHLQHLYDNLELTFGEIKEVIRNASEGKLEKASEKLDGMNLVFTYDVAEGRLKVARTGSDIKGGGMDAAGLAKKFFGRGNVELAFNSAFKVLNEAMAALPDKVKAKVFGPKGNRWYSMEIIYAPDPNTINYDSNNIVFHGWPIFDVKKDGSVEQSDDDSGVGLLTSKIEQMQKAVSMKDWKVRGPSLMTLKKISDGSVVQKAIGEIDAAMANAGSKDSDSVYDYLTTLMNEEVADLGLPPKVAKMVVARAVEAPGAPGIPEIKKATPKEFQAAAIDFIKASEPLKKRMVAPIEGAIHNFAIEVLRGLNSTLIAKSDEEVARLKAQVTKAIRAIEGSGNQIAMDVLQKEMARLGSVENIGAAMEGIVFFFKGQAYKFTGAFAPAHQILSLFKYGRKGVPKMDMGEALLRRAIQHLLREGGHAFADVKPVALADFQSTWPHIKDDLKTMGCTKVEFIGTTGKKPIMGDVDLAAEFPGTRDELFDMAKDMFGADSVAKVGPNIVTIRYPVHAKAGGLSGDYVQVDVMLGKASYLTWSRFGTSPTQGHADYSPVKGVVRNVLLNVINRYAAETTFPGKQTELDRTRYSVDFDKGLFKVVQTKRGKDPKKPPLKDWRTLERELVSDDPDAIAQVMFGKGTSASDIRTFEGLVAALRKSPTLKAKAREILMSFASEMRELVAKTPHMLGDNPDQALDYIDQVAKGR